MFHTRKNILFSPFVVAACVAAALPHAAAQAQTDSLAVNNVDFGYQYVSTTPLEYVTIWNVGTADIHVFSISVPAADTNIFHVRYGLDSLTLPPNTFHRFTVAVTVPDTLVYSTTLTVLSDATADTEAQVTLTVHGAIMSISTSLPDVQSYPYQYISIPVIAGAVADPVGRAYVQRYFCRVQYDPTLLTIDTTALIQKSDTIGVSSGFTFTVDSSSRPGDAKLFAFGTTGGIHSTGDTILKINFFANQVLEHNSTSVAVAFAPDSTMPYVHFTSQSGTFSELPCQPPAAAYPVAIAHLLAPFPNPFNPQSVIRFSMDKTGFVAIGIFNGGGELVRSLVNGIVAQGEHSLPFDASSLPSGAYYCRLWTPVSTEIRCMAFSK